MLSVSVTLRKYNGQVGEHLADVKALKNEKKTTDGLLWRWARHHH